ncbi:MAG: hypothetical protein V1802_03335 [Candidatus Aenigmatarchaeota archaeon]
MGRKKGFNEKKIAGIIAVLMKNPDGIWIRRIAKELDISPATVIHYVNNVMAPLVDEIILGDTGKPLLRVIKLKLFVFERLERGEDLKQIFRMLKIIEKIEK